MQTILNVKDFIISEFLPDSDANQLADDLDLFEHGIIDSLGVLKIVAAIENELNVSLDPEHLQADNYRTVATIQALMDTQLANKKLHA